MKSMYRNRLFSLKSAFALSLSVFLGSAVGASAAESVEPIHALLITGGGYHDYEAQKKILTEGISARTQVEWTIDDEGGTDVAAKISRHRNTEWASEFDVVVYNMCYSSVSDVEWIERIVDAHYEHDLPAVIIHSALHSYRGDTEKWFEFAGMTSHRHQSHQAYTIENLAPKHPIMRDFPETWTTPKGELYEIAKIWPNTTPLARAFGKDSGQYHADVWTSNSNGVRVFGTTIGHHNETMQADEFLGLVTRGLLWSVDKLGNDGKPRPGYGKEDEGWVRIFDGKTLDGWKANENQDSFSVRDGKIVVDGPRSHLFYEGPVADANFDNFEFKADVYTYPKANSGIFIHTKFQNDGWPSVGYEAQVNATHGDPRKTGSLYAVKDVMHDAPHADNEWFTYHIKVVGDHIVFKINGETVLDYVENPDDIQGTRKLGSGTIALQAHDPDSVIYYKNLYVRPLPDDPK